MQIISYYLKTLNEKSLLHEIKGKLIDGAVFNTFQKKIFNYQKREFQDKFSWIDPSMALIR